METIGNRLTAVKKNLTDNRECLNGCILSALALAIGAMHTVQPKNSFINRYYKKRSISPRNVNANYTHSRYQKKR